jgi:hypothetical protein
LRPHLENITRAKWTGGVAQVEEDLLYKLRALCSNLSPTKNEKKEKRTWDAYVPPPGVYFDIL